MKQEEKTKPTKKAKAEPAEKVAKTTQAVGDKTMTEKQATSATAVKESLAAIPAQWLKTKEAITAGNQDAFMASMKTPGKW